MHRGFTFPNGVNQSKNCMNCNECLWPWNHMYYNVDGVYPCCKLASSPVWKLGETTASVSELWNSEKMRGLRKQFMAGQPPAECRELCLDTPNPFNIHLPINTTGKIRQFYKETGNDGSFKENFVIFNVATSNLCNFKCAYCSATYSSRIAEDSYINEMFNQPPIRPGVRHAFKDKEQALKLFVEQLPHLQKLSFITGTIYQILIRM